MILKRQPADGPSCLVCANPKTDFDFAKKDFAIYRCARCGFQFVYPPPPDTASIYSEDYFRGARHGFGYVNYDEDKVAMQAFFEAVLKAMERLLPARGQLLDVGAATGFFLKLARGRGWVVAGLEISGYASRLAQRSGLPVTQGTLQSAGYPSNSFDAVVLLDVIEHLSDPAALVDQCRRILRPGGLLVINTPDTSSLWARIYKSRWHAFCPPEHLSYFSPSNHGRILDRRGFKIERKSKLGKRFKPAYVFSMLSRWQKLRLWERLAKWSESNFLNRVALPINIRDNFFMIAKKGIAAANDKPRL
mgnify:FL=1